MEVVKRQIARPFLLYSEHYVNKMKPEVHSSRRIALPIDVVYVKHAHPRSCRYLWPHLSWRRKFICLHFTACETIIIFLFVQFEVGFWFLHNSYRLFVCVYFWNKKRIIAFKALNWKQTKTTLCIRVSSGMSTPNLWIDMHARDPYSKLRNYLYLVVSHRRSTSRHSHRRTF